MKKEIIFRKYWILIFLFVSIFVFLFAFFLGRTRVEDMADSVKETTQNISEAILPKPTPFSFDELTIPFLRARSYESKLGELIKVSENANYTSYVTSYDSDGLEINGLLTIPKDNPPAGGWPAIVFIHGYIPPASYKTTQNYASYVDYLAKNGFVVFKIDLRGHGESEGEAEGGYYSEGYVVDTLNAYSALQNAPFVDKDKIGLWGHSMAGNVVFRSMVVKKDIPGVAVWAGAGYTYEDLGKYMIDDNSYRPPAPDSEQTRRRKLLRDTYGSFDPESDFWKQVVPTNYLDGVSGAVSLNHAKDDAVVDVGYSRDLNKLLNNTLIKHELNEYPSGGHNISGSSFNEAMQNTVDFFKKSL